MIGVRTSTHRTRYRSQPTSLESFFLYSINIIVFWCNFLLFFSPSHCPSPKSFLLGTKMARRFFFGLFFLSFFFSLARKEEERERERNSTDALSLSLSKPLKTHEKLRSKLHKIIECLLPKWKKINNNTSKTESPLLLLLLILASFWRKRKEKRYYYDHCLGSSTPTLLVEVEERSR